MSFIKRLFGRKKSVLTHKCIPDVCINSYLYATETTISEHKNKSLLKYPIVYRAVDLISKSVSTNTYFYKDYEVVANTSTLYKIFFNSFLRDTYVQIEIVKISDDDKKIYLTIKEDVAGIKVENKQLSLIVNKLSEVQLELYYELLVAYYKSSKVQGVLLPSNTENQNSISFTLNEQVELSERLVNIFTDIKNAYNIISLTIPFEYIPINKKFDDTGLIQLKELIKEDVAYVFGIPSLLLENNSNSTYNNLSEAQRSLQDNLSFYTSVVSDLFANYIDKTKIIKK